MNLRYLMGMGAAALLAALLLAGPAAALESQPVADGDFEISEEDRAKIKEALPEEAPAEPEEPRKLLIFDRNVVYGGHPSRFYANLALQQMGEKTGAFDVVITRDPAAFDKENLEQFDAVFLNNTVGNIFTDPQRRQNLVEFVYGGGGLMGAHGTTVAFYRWDEGGDDWPFFGYMIGGRGANHRAGDELAYLKIDSPGHPLVAPFPEEGFEYRDEYFRVGDPYSRELLRVLFSIDVDKTDLSGKPHEREDQDYAVAWVRNFGKGRVFYTSLAHTPAIFWDPQMLQFYLAATQFALGDLEVPTTPSALVTPGVRAQEELDWRLGMTAYTFHQDTMFEAIEKTAELGLPYFGGLSFQKVSADIPKNFDASLTDEELQQIREKLDQEGVRLLTSFYAQIPGDEEGCRRVFEFARKMGIETLISEPPVEALDTIERFCDEYGINLAIHNHGPEASPRYWSPEKLLEVLEGRSERIGACPDLGYWMRAGVDPVEGVKTLGDRIITVQLHELNQVDAEGHDVPWGQGTQTLEEVLRAMHEMDIEPTMFGLEYSHNFGNAMPEIKQSIEWFNNLAMELAKEE